jgi:hypothetical protein
MIMKKAARQVIAGPLYLRFAHPIKNHGSFHQGASS